MNRTYFIIIAILFMLTMLINKISGNKRIIQRSIFTSCLGIVVLIAINCTSFLTGVSIPISPMSLAISAFGGLPGITLILSLNLFF